MSSDPVYSTAILLPLWCHQAQAIDELRVSLRNGRKRVMIQLPTGAGKTKLPADITRGALGKGKKAAFLVPLVSLVDQTVKAFAAEGIDAVGVMQADHPLTHCFAHEAHRMRMPRERTSQLRSRARGAGYLPTHSSAKETRRCQSL
jgi:Type III restriction enzyme, res subunit